MSKMIYNISRLIGRPTVYIKQIGNVPPLLPQTLSVLTTEVQSETRLKREENRHSVLEREAIVRGQRHRRRRLKVLLESSLGEIEDPGRPSHQKVSISVQSWNPTCPTP